MSDKRSKLSVHSHSVHKHLRKSTKVPNWFSDLQSLTVHRHSENPKRFQNRVSCSMTCVMMSNIAGSMRLQTDPATRAVDYPLRYSLQGSAYRIPWTGWTNIHWRLCRPRAGLMQRLWLQPRAPSCQEPPSELWQYWKSGRVLTVARCIRLNVIRL